MGGREADSELGRVSNRYRIFGAGRLEMASAKGTPVDGRVIISAGTQFEVLAG